MGARAKFIPIALIFLFGIDLHAQGIPYQLNPPAPNARVQFCPVPDGGYPCPTLTTVYSDSATTQVINQPISTGSSGNLSVYFAAGTSSVTVQFLGQGYGPQNRFVVSLGGGGGIPSQFNVKDPKYGAVGDTRASHNCTTSSASKIVTNTDNPWTAADVGKFMEIAAPAQGTDVFTPARKIASFQSAGQVTMDALQDGSATPSSGQYCKWFTQDDTAAFQAAVTAAKQSLGTKMNDPFLQSPTLAYPPQVVCPAGGYTVSSTIFYDGKGTGSNNTLGIGFVGIPTGACVIYPTATFSGVTDTLCTGNQTGLISVCQTFRSDIEGINVEGQQILIPSSGLANGQGFIIFDKCKTCTVRDINVNEIGTATGNTYILYLFSSSGIYANLYIQNGGGATSNAAVACRIESSQSVLFENNLCSNQNQSLQIINSGGRGSGGGQLTLLNQTTDECGGSSGTIPCTLIQGSAVNYIGGTSFGGVPELMSIDGTSQVFLEEHNLQQFGSGAGNVPAILEVAGSYVEASGSTLVSNGNSPIVSGPSTATFVDVGGNTFQNCLSGTCAAITAANFATKGFSGGIVPKSTQTHTPNTCYAVTGNLLATAQNLCVILLDQNYQLLTMSAQSGGTTPANSACATPPVITLSDGTRTATLTMTSGKTQWFSNVDAVTNLNQVFATGATLTVSIGANTCATPPSNVSVNYNLQSAVNP